MAVKLLIDHQSGTDLQGTDLQSKDLQSKDLLGRHLPDGDLRPASRPAGGSPPKPMNRESQVRSVAVLLFLLTVAAVIFAGFNFNAEWKFLVPDDGVWWVEHGGGLTADRVEPSRPGATSGLHTG